MNWRWQDDDHRRRWRLDRALQLRESDASIVIRVDLIEKSANNRRWRLVPQCNDCSAEVFSSDLPIPVLIPRPEEVEHARVVGIESGTQSRKQLLCLTRILWLRRRRRQWRLLRLWRLVRLRLFALLRRLLALLLLLMLMLPLSLRSGWRQRSRRRQRWLCN